MPLPDSSLSICEVQMRGLVAAKGSNSRNSVSIWHFKRGSTSGTLSEAAIETAFQAAIAVPVTDALNERYSQTFNTVRMIEDVSRLEYQNARAVAGAITGDSMPTTMMAFLLARTVYRGKNFLGKKKLFPFSESDTTAATADLWNAGCLTRLGTIASAWLAGFTDSNGNVWAPIVVSRAQSQLRYNPTIVTYASITATLVNKRIGRMRKREVASVY